MRRLYNLARASQVAARLLNRLQDEQAGLTPASDQSSGATAVLLTGADGRWWTTPDAGVPDAQLRVIDASVDWRSRRVWGVLRVLGAAARRPGGADDHLPNDPTGATNARMFNGWTGTGGLGAAAATVANGTPPVIADNQYAVLLDEGATTADRVWLYARPSDGALCVYNDSGATLHAELLVWGAAAAPTPGATPSEYPAPVYVLWLPPTVAASRPATPDPAEQIALHRATDTGAVSLWDGAAWRSLGLVSPLTTRGDIWRRDGSGDARLALGAAGTLLTSDGTDPVWRTVEDALPGAEIETSDDVWTTIATIGVDDLSVALLDLFIVALRDDASAAGAWRGSTAWRRYGGAMHEVAPLSLLLSDTEAVGLEVRAQASGTTGVAVQVKGLAATDYSWRVSYLRTSI